MARSIEFDKSQALSAAIEAIWHRGYHAVSTSDLTAEMGLARSSLYNTFGSKREVFMTALAQYSTERAAQLAKSLGHQPVPKGIRALLTAIAKDNDAGKGCLLVNSAVEVAPHDPEIAAIVQEGFSQMAHVFESALRAGQARGEIRAGIEPKAEAITLVSGIAGLRVLAKAGFSAKVLNPTIEALLSRVET
ncbi:TetR/AcrR family transcriptional regulator (plasmid) [Cupriavidus sp. KK10]|jgi:TetR/AcrR family transcriptional repressor of nem operon|uniref:TetR/AcrR family transcriptional regulator n=1 Tax=Cupriavidus sp. KK10 TaxID=1478019 RepID=UPI001BA8EF95|nr:TetR/AcrR family transcriptional regulator [Cupriavidus sp. KK10]QUN31718.1 TetR/AcrR family transcriptional regulator [Cupriavidus sp. KK10]